MSFAWVLSASGWKILLWASACVCERPSRREKRGFKVVDVYKAKLIIFMIGRSIAANGPSISLLTPPHTLRASIVWGKLSTRDAFTLIHFFEYFLSTREK